jgi:hypothetical protein
MSRSSETFERLVLLDATIPLVDIILKRAIFSKAQIEHMLNIHYA